MATLIDGKKVAADLLARVAAEVEALKRKGVAPCLAVVIAGDDPASRVYVRNKEADCEKVGILSREIALPQDTAEEELLGIIDGLNADPLVHGILVQLPLPEQIDERRVLRRIGPGKDVDAFHPESVGHIMIGDPVFLPCTPAGVMELLRAYGIEAAGKNCVVVGRSNIVGKPMAMLLLHAHGTVTVCHSKTGDLASVTRQADILVSAIGRPKFITADMVKPGAAVIDVGINRGENGKLCGDVDYAAVEPVAGYITPVPGGVGPMTRALLMQNTLAAAKLAESH